MKPFAVACALVALGLLGWGAYRYRVETRPPAPAPEPKPVEVEGTERDLGERPVGASRLVFRVTNPSDQAAEVVSAPDGCWRGCCIKPVTPRRMPIPPGESVEVVCELYVTDPGPFTLTAPLYIFDREIRTIKLQIRGVGVEKGSNDEPVKP